MSRYDEMENQMRKSMFVIAFAMALPISALVAQTGASANADEEAVKETIVTAYIQGIHNERDVEKIRSGFHPDFNMLSYRDNNVNKVNIEQWIGGIESSLERNPDPPDVPVHHEFTAVQISGNAAVAQIEVFRGERHLYSDFMSLYKFDDGWKIVNKIYYSHPG